MRCVKRNYRGCLCDERQYVTVIGLRVDEPIRLDLAQRNVSLGDISMKECLFGGNSRHASERIE